MLITENIARLVNEQIGHEFAASVQYIAMSAHFADEGLPELSVYFRKQAAEEHEHAMKFIKFIGDSAASLDIPAISKPVNKFKSVEEAVKLAYDQEIKVTRQIEAILELANKEKNHITQNFLQWFVEEQLEEVSSMDNLLKVIRRVGEDRLFAVEEYIARHGHPEDAKEGEKD